MNDRVFKTLVSLAIENPGIRNKFKIAAAVCYKKDIIATGINQIKSHPIMTNSHYHRQQIYLHAEADAIRKSIRIVGDENLSKCSIHVLRVKKDQHFSDNWMLGNARPCNGCMSLITEFGFKELFWSVDCQFNNIEVDNLVF